MIGRYLYFWDLPTRFGGVFYPLDADHFRYVYHVLKSQKKKKLQGSDRQIMYSEDILFYGFYQVEYENKFICSIELETDALGIKIQDIIWIQEEVDLGPGMLEHFWIAGELRIFELRKESAYADSVLLPFLRKLKLDRIASR